MQPHLGCVNQTKSLSGVLMKKKKKKKAKTLTKYFIVVVIIGYPLGLAPKFPD